MTVKDRSLESRQSIPEFPPERCDTLLMRCGWRNAWHIAVRSQGRSAVRFVWALPFYIGNVCREGFTFNRTASVCDDPVEALGRMLLFLVVCWRSASHCKLDLTGFVGGLLRRSTGGITSSNGDDSRLDPWFRLCVRG